MNNREAAEISSVFAFFSTPLFFFSSSYLLLFLLLLLLFLLLLEEMYQRASLSLPIDGAPACEEEPYEMQRYVQHTSAAELINDRDMGMEGRKETEKLGLHKQRLP